VTGQDGAYLAESLLPLGYVVRGIKRRLSSSNTERVDHLCHDQHLGDLPLLTQYCGMTDSTNLIRLAQQLVDEVKASDLGDAKRDVALLPD